jgi:hypothetical protein
MQKLKLTLILLVFFALAIAGITNSSAQQVVRIKKHMVPPEWAKLERQLLNENVGACRVFFEKYFDDRGYLQCFVRWGANDGPDDAFENFNRWPELHALGASDEILKMYLTGWEGMLRQYTEAKTLYVPAGRDGMYYKEFSPQSDWMHHGEGMQLFNRMGLSIPMDSKYQERARCFAGFYMNEDPEAQNYDFRHKIIRSMINGSKGPLLRDATPIDWVGDPFDIAGFVTVHRERTYAEFIAHYEPYTDVIGDNFLNLAATVLATNAYLIAHEGKYKTWLLEYMDAWLMRMEETGGIIPSYVALNGKIGGPEGRWWGNAYGWGFSPINPVTGEPADRNRISRALIGFQNALLISGDQKYVDAWRRMSNVINANAKMIDGKMSYPTMYGDEGWYGWKDTPWNVGALQVWYWSMRSEDLEKVESNEWVAYLQGNNPGYPVNALKADLKTLSRRLEFTVADTLSPEKRLADNMLGYNPATTESLIELMLGGLQPGVGGELLNARLRYFDPLQKRAGVPEDVAALVSRMTDTTVEVTLINLSKTHPRTVIVQAGAYGEHQFKTLTVGKKTIQVNAPTTTIELAPASGQKLSIRMDRYSNTPTILFPWQR